ncbi:MAG: hypothetical protein RJB13_1381, partial [Pseudomonadota bacterium]
MPNDNQHQIEVLNGYELTLEQIVRIAKSGYKVELCPKAIEKVRSSRLAVEERLRSNETFYGINTGFGALASVRIPHAQLQQLQINLIRSHACGVGDSLDSSAVRAVMVLRLQTMLRGNSGVREEILRQMEFFLNEGIHPVVPSQGSVGACGDLAPLAHLALSLIGEGHCEWNGSIHPTAEVLTKLERKAIVPEAKEGLSLINGTQVMTALGLLGLDLAAQLLCTADISASMSLDATLGTATAFRSEIHSVRPHLGQITAAKNMRRVL